jgi:hypothetical protein
LRGTEQELEYQGGGNKSKKIKDEGCKSNKIKEEGAKARTLRRRE